MSRTGPPVAGGPSVGVVSRATLLPLLLLVAVLAAAAGAQLAPRGPDAAAGWQRTRVERVVDGDTVVLRGLGPARLIGVDTPETHGGVECFGPAAAAFTTRSLRGRAVLVRAGVEPRDRYGRALVYLRRPGTVLFNGELLRRGYARRLRIPPNVAFDGRFDALVAAARRAAAGLWGRCP